MFRYIIIIIYEVPTPRRISSCDQSPRARGIPRKTGSVKTNDWNEPLDIWMLERNKRRKVAYRSHTGRISRLGLACFDIYQKFPGKIVRKQWTTFSEVSTAYFLLKCLKVWEKSYSFVYYFLPLINAFWSPNDPPGSKGS